MKLLAIWFCGNQSMANGALEDRLAHLSICWRRTPGSPETACRQRGMTGLAGEREPWGSTEVGLVVVVVVVVVVAVVVAVVVVVVNSVTLLWTLRLSHSAALFSFRCS